MYKTGWIVGSFLAGTAVVLGAFGAHALKQVLDVALLQSFETGVRYQFYHSIALLLISMVSAWRESKWWRYAAWFFIVGTLLFSGSIYLLVALKSAGHIGLGGFGLLTPIGGLCFIVGWIMTALGAKDLQPK